MREYSVNWQRSEGHRLSAYGKTYKTLAGAKNKARNLADDIFVKRCTVFSLHEGKTVFDALAEKYGFESIYNQ